MKKNIQKGGQDKILMIDNGNNNMTSKSLPDIVKPIPYDVKIFAFMAILGILVRILVARIGKDYATATVYGYGFTILALFGLLISSFAISYKNQFSQGVYQFMKNLTANALPVLLNLLILILILVQTIYFYDKINSGKVADEYYQFSGVSAFLIIVQISLVIKYLMDKLIGNTSNNATKSGILDAVGSQINSIILILSIANIAFIGMLQVILKYFSTDG